MLKTLLFYPTLILSIISISITLLRVNYLQRKGKIEESTMLIHKTTHSWAKFILKISGAKVTVTGSENIPKDTTILFVANHQSYFDIPLLIGAIDVPKGFIAKKELAKWIGIRVWMKYLRCTFLDRDNMRKSAEAIVEGINTLKSGYSMVVFPEGTRSKGKDPSEFKAGSFKLATKAKVPIVPVTIDGTYNLLEANDNKIKSASIKVIIHPIIDIASLSREEINELPNTVRYIVLNPLN
jgi:1-acyl-sn-glycerol-3-phosphate acyltransferase